MTSADSRKPLALVGALAAAPSEAHAPQDSPARDGRGGPLRKIAAILCADVEGYSRLMRDDDLATLHDILATRRVFARHVQATGGRLVDTAGDSMLADFGSAVDALGAAVAIQQELGAENALRPLARRMQLRIGLNIGDILEHDEALYGDGVNAAARLQQLGEAGGVCVSASVHELVEGRLPVAFEYAGEHVLKNIPTPMGVYHVRWGGEPDAGDVIASAAARAQPPPRPRLPQALSSFVGREEQIQALRNLAAQHRLITLVGPGGIGKTRLARRLTELAETRHGVFFVDLAALDDARLLLPAVAAALGIRLGAVDAMVEALLAALEDRRWLIVLDNCEHLADACAVLAGQLLARAPRLRILATSREPLRVSGELVFPLPALMLPDDGDEIDTPQALSAFEATRLFIERAGVAAPGMLLSRAESAAIVRICRRLDGMPLAIELAAARVRVMSIDDIERRLDRVFGLLVDGDRSASPRQQALRATIDWSHDLLDASERRVFARLAVFPGSWTLEAAEVVASGDASEKDRVAGLLARLVEKSLVMRTADGRRYRLLQTMRQYALEKLEGSGEHDAARDAHLAFFLELAEAARVHLSGPEQGHWLARLDAEQENLAAAHGRCERAADGGHTGLRLLFALKLYFYNRGQFQLLAWGLKEALDRPGAQGATPLRARALHTLGQVLGILEQREAAAPVLTQALATAEATGDVARGVMVLQEMGLAALAQDDLPSARERLALCLERAEKLDEPRLLTAAVSAMGHWYRMAKDFTRAELHYRRAHGLATELGDDQTLAVALMNLAITAIARGDEAQAADLLVSAGAIARRLNSKPAGQCLLAVTSGLAALRKEWRRTVRLASSFEAQSGVTGMFLDPADRAFLDPLWRGAREHLGAQDHAAAEAMGRAQGYELSMGDALAWLEAIRRGAEAR